MTCTSHPAPRSGGRATPSRRGANPAVPWGRHQLPSGAPGPSLPCPLLLRQDSRPLPTFLPTSGTLSTAPVVLKLWLRADSAGVSQTVDCGAPPPEFLNQLSRSGLSRLFATPWTTARQASLSITNSWSSLKLMSIESLMASSHLILCPPLLLPSIFPSIRVFSK